MIVFQKSLKILYKPNAFLTYSFYQHYLLLKLTYFLSSMLIPFYRPFFFVKQFPIYSLSFCLACQLAPIYHKQTHTSLYYLLFHFEEMIHPIFSKYYIFLNGTASHIHLWRSKNTDKWAHVKLESEFSGVGHSNYSLKF